MVRFSFCGIELAALAQGALYWPGRRALLVADLHLEKASWFAKGGQMLPPYDTLATLADLTALAAATAAEEIWCLGDSFHDSEGCERLPAEAREMLTALTGGLDAQHREILRAAGREAEALVPVADRLLRFPLRQEARRSA